MDPPDSPPPLMGTFASAPDTRSRRGRSYDPAILALCDGLWET